MSTETETDNELWSATHEQYAQRASAALDRDDLAEALFAVDGWHVSDDNLGQARARLQEWTNAIKSAQKEGTVPPETLLESVLVEQSRVTGDGEHYYDVANSRLADVVATGQGMPILLAAIWVIVGRGAGLNCSGIGMPGHFIARIDETFVDPFHAGRTLAVEDLAKQAERFAPDTPFKTEWLDPVSPIDWVLRVLNNLANSWYRAGSNIDHYRARRFARVMADTPHTWHAEGYAAMLLGAAHLAEETWQTVLSRWPGSLQATDAVRRLADLRTDETILN